MKKYWVSADYHLGHFNIAKLCNRPFSTKGEMEVALIRNTNSKVKRDDDLYLLGDICFNYNAEKFLDQLICKNVYLIRGNHDYTRHLKGAVDKFKWIKDYAVVHINGQKIILFHYPIKCWDGKRYGTWQLYGHCHGNLPDDPNALAIDVGVDCHNYFPLEFEDIKAIMAKKNFNPQKRGEPEEKSE